MNCRLDIACTVTKLRHVTGKGFEANSDVKLVNRIIRNLRKSSVVLPHPKLYLKILHIRTYADSSHAESKELAIQLGFVVFLYNSKDNVAIISYDPTNVDTRQD